MNDYGVCKACGAPLELHVEGDPPGTVLAEAGCRATMRFVCPDCRQSSPTTAMATASSGATPLAIR